MKTRAIEPPVAVCHAVVMRWLAFLLLLASHAIAAVIHVTPRQPLCTPVAGLEGKGTADAPYTNLYYALTQGHVQCGDTVQLHAGTYRVSSRAAHVFADGTPEERNAQCDDDPTDDGGPSVYDGSRTVMPLFRTCTREQPLVIENAPGEAVILDGTVLDWDRTDLWKPCESASQCGPAQHLHLTDSTRTFWTNRLATCGLSGPNACDVQMWIDPTPTSPGRRIGWWANPGQTGTILSPEPSDHDRFDEADLTGLDGALGGRFVALNNIVIARLNVAAAAGRFDLGQHAVRFAGEGYQGGVGAVISAYGAHWITVRRNPAGGSFRARFGYPVIAVRAGSSDLLFEGLDLEACGGRGYGNCLRTMDGDRITIRGGTATEAMGEVIAHYGGGPGCSSNNGCGRQLHDCSVEGVRVSRGGRAFYDGGGVGTSLGDGIALKNCEGCRVVGNTVSDTFSRGIRVNTSGVKLQCSAADRSDPSSCDWMDTTGATKRGRCVDGRCLTDRCENTDAPCSSDGFVIDGNTISNSGHFQFQNRPGAPYPPPVGGTADGGCIWVTVQEGWNHATNGRVVNNMCLGDYHPARTEPITGIKIQGIDGGPTAGSDILVANNTVSAVNGYCFDALELTQPITFVNNIFDACGQAPGFAERAAALLSPTVAYRHHHNSYSRTPVAIRRPNEPNPIGDLSQFEPTAISTAAVFVSSSDLHLRCEAPQRHRGESLAPVVTHDIDREPRPTDHSAGDWDIGADQTHCPP